MSQLAQRGRTTLGVSLLVTVAMAAAMMLYSGGSPANSATGSAAKAAAGSFHRVAHNPDGNAKSKIVGQTANGRRVTGYFTPLGFSKRHGHLWARGLVSGVIHNPNGTTRTFTVMRTVRVKSMNGTVPGSARSAAAQAAAPASCSILHLVLGPLDLNLLGLHVHLNKVVLDITAQPGPGNLLGNLLCAVAHLLDTGGTLGQLLTQLQNILNQLLMGL